MLLIIGALSALVGTVTLFTFKTTAVSDIAVGGVDGPAVTFFAGKIGAPMYGAIIVGSALVIMGIILLLKKRK